MKSLCSSLIATDWPVTSFTPGALIISMFKQWTGWGISNPNRRQRSLLSRFSFAIYIFRLHEGPRERSCWFQTVRSRRQANKVTNLQSALPWNWLEKVNDWGETVPAIYRNWEIRQSSHASLRRSGRRSDNFASKNGKLRNDMNAEMGHMRLPFVPCFKVLISFPIHLLTFDRLSRTK